MAVRRKKRDSYSFAQLSEKAQAVAIKEYRDRGHDLFDHDDALFLTETFEEDLKNHYGLGDFKAYWSLGYCQGDGVCFEGTVDMKTFVEAENQQKRFGPLVGLVRAKVKHTGRYCHWNSMDVEVEGEGTPVDLLSSSMREEFSEWESEHRLRERERIEVEFRRTLPIRQWQEQVAEWREKTRRHHHKKQDWTPRVPEPPPQPQEADIPMPPSLVMPEHLKAAYDAAAEEFIHFDEKLKEFEEYLTDRVKQISKELEKNGYDEIEYHDSDEYIAESVAGEEREYNEDGTFKDED